MKSMGSGWENLKIQLALKELILDVFHYSHSPTSVTVFRFNKSIFPLKVVFVVLKNTFLEQTRQITIRTFTLS